jgi:hypothetical protein
MKFGQNEAGWGDEALHTVSAPMAMILSMRSTRLPFAAIMYRARSPKHCGREAKKGSGGAWRYG